MTTRGWPGLTGFTPRDWLNPDFALDFGRAALIRPLQDSVSFVFPD
jgi:hypothetical protein